LLLTLVTVLEGGSAEKNEWIGLIGFWVLSCIIVFAPLGSKLEIGSNNVKSYFFGFRSLNLSQRDVISIEYKNLFKAGGLGYGKGLIIGAIIIIVFAIVLKLTFNYLPTTTIKNGNDISLLGYWKGDHEENPGFEITKDYFITGDQKLTYKTDSSGNITINYPDSSFNGHYIIVGNKLYLTNSQGGEDVYSRWCEDQNDICE
jgi:hypothetical protein